MSFSRLTMTLTVILSVTACSLIGTAASLPEPEKPKCPNLRPVTFEILEPGTKIATRDRFLAGELRERVYALDQEEVKRLLRYIAQLEAVAGCSH